jgi:hypothetical protein
LKVLSMGHSTLPHLSATHTRRLNNTRTNKLTSDSFVNIHITPLSKQNNIIFRMVLLKYKQY